MIDARANHMDRCITACELQRGRFSDYFFPLELFLFICNERRLKIMDDSAYI